MAPPSVHPDGKAYAFEVAPNGALPEVDVGELLGLGEVDSLAQSGQDASVRQNTAPSDFAIRYGKSPFPQFMCGKATKILTRSDGRMKKLVSMRCWKWHCPKCVPLLKRHWMGKLKDLPRRFIVHCPSEDKPTHFLRRSGRPQYVRIVENGESWILLLDADTNKIMVEASRAGYTVVAGDIASDPETEDIEDCLDKALQREHEPLNTNAEDHPLKKAL